MRRLLLLALCVLAGCGSDSPKPSAGELGDGPPISGLQPGMLVPGSVIVIRGDSFVPPESGSSILHLNGILDGQPAEATLPARFVDYDRMEADWPGATAAGMPVDYGAFVGNARIRVDSFLDAQTHISPPFHVEVEVARTLEPTLSLVDVASTGYVNQPVRVQGNGFLLGGSEGVTGALVEGCFQPQGSSQCNPVQPVEVPCAPESAFDRSVAVFPFHPAIAGIHPGSFKGSVRLRNDAGGQPGVVESASLPFALTLKPTEIFSIAPATSSLGQFVILQGGGFVGGDEMSYTTLTFSGTFTPEGGSPTPIPALSVIPEFVSGQVARYILNSDDGLGDTPGSFSGNVTPEIHFGADAQAGASAVVHLGIDPVKQVVWLKFLPSYVESLRYFGLREAEPLIRARVFEVARRDYEGVNTDFRDAEPKDFALFSSVEISGPDPNGLGLLGYDNTPGKDTNNVRLYDKIGGVNATTQEDGYPGYGGVFVESFFGFSTAPGKFAKKLDGADELFDQIFDPFRPDRGGIPVSSDEVAVALAPLTSGDSCPAGDRETQLVCAVWALGSMIGTTMTHEVGHSLGLADPGGSDFHNPGDQPSRLMDSGGARSLRERMEIGEVHAMFCDDDYSYLRVILPTKIGDPQTSRPSCY